MLITMLFRRPLEFDSRGITDNNGEATFPIVFAKPLQVVTNIARGDQKSYNNFDNDIDDSLTTTGFKYNYFKHRYICIGV